MPLDRIQIPDGQQQTVVRPEPQLLAQGGSLRSHVPDTVGNHRNSGLWNPQVPTDFAGQAFRDRHGLATDPHRRTQRQTPPEPARVIAAAMHRDDMRNPGTPRGPGAVNRHRELVAVRDVNSMSEKDVLQ